VTIYVSSFLCGSKAPSAFCAPLLQTSMQLCIEEVKDDVDFKAEECDATKAK